MKRLSVVMIVACFFAAQFVFSAQSAKANLSVRVEGCFRDQASPHVICRLSLRNDGQRDIKTRFNTSSDRRTGGLDEFVSWAWDNLGRQYQIIDVRIGGGTMRRWRLEFTLPAGLQIPGEIVVGNVAPDAKSITRLSLTFSPGLPIWNDIEAFDFSNVEIE